MLYSNLYRRVVLNQLVSSDLMSRATAQREVDAPPRDPEPLYMETRSREHIIDCVERGFLSRRTAMKKLGIENPDRERDDIFMEKMTERPDVQAFILQTAQQLNRAKYPWRYPR